MWSGCHPGCLPQCSSGMTMRCGTAPAPTPTPCRPPPPTRASRAWRAGMCLRTAHAPVPAPPIPHTHSPACCCSSALRWLTTSKHQVLHAGGATTRRWNDLGRPACQEPCRSARSRIAEIPTAESPTGYGAICVPHLGIIQHPFSMPPTLRLCCPRPRFYLLFQHHSTDKVLMPDLKVGATMSFCCPASGSGSLASGDYSDSGSVCDGLWDRRPRLSAISYKCIQSCHRLIRCRLECSAATGSGNDGSLWHG